jgi:hypothetical protein
MDRKRNFNRHQKRPFAGRSQQPPPSAGRREAQDSYNARRNYERYMALAQAELQAGDRVAAENYYQHAEHYFYGLGIELAPQANQFPQIRLGGRGWESLRFNADGKCSLAYGLGRRERRTKGAAGGPRASRGSPPAAHRSRLADSKTQKPRRIPLRGRLPLYSARLFFSAQYPPP